MSREVITFLLQFFTGYLLQGLAFVLFIYAYNRAKITAGKFSLVVACTTIFIFISRHININFGVHTIINIVILVLWSFLFLKFPVVKSTVGCLIITVIMFVLEMVVVIGEQLIFGADVFKERMLDPYYTALYAVPATLLLFLISFISYKISTGKKQNDEESFV